MNPNSAIPNQTDMQNQPGVIPVSTFLQNDQAQQQQQSQPPATTPQAGNQPSWWEKLLPTAGGVLGGIVGLPGDLISGGLSSVGGAAAGGALGQGLENWLTGQNPLQGNDVSSGLMNGVGELAGLGIGKAADALGGAALGKGADMAANAAQATQGQADKAEIARLADEFKVAPGTGDLATKSGDVVNNLQQLGFDKPMAQDAFNVGNTITGANENGVGIINGEKQALLKSAGGKVNIGQFGDTTTPSGKLLAQLQDPSVQANLGDPLAQGGKITPASAILSKFNTLANGAGVPAEGAGLIDPEAGFKLLGDVANESQAAKLAANRVGASTADVEKANVWNQLKHNLKTALYDRPEVNTAVSNYQVTPEVEAQIEKKIAAEGITGSQAATVKQSIMDTLNNGQTMQDWLNAEKQGVDMAEVGKSALKQQGNISAASTKRLAGLTNNPDMTPSASNGVVDTAAGILTKLGHPVALAGAAAKHIHDAGLTPKVLEAAGEALKGSAHLIPPVTTAIANAPDINNNVTNSAIPIPGAQGGITGMNGNQPINPLAQTYDLALAGADPTTMAQLAPQLQKQQLAAQALQQLSQEYQNAGGAGGTGGILNQLVGHLVPGSSQNMYLNAQANAAKQLQALGINVPLPSLMNSQQTALPAQAGYSGLVNYLTSSIQ